MTTTRLHKRDRLVLLFLILTLLLSIFLQDCRGQRSTSSRSTPSIPNLSLVLTGSGFTHPLGITHAGDGSGRLFIVEQGGLVKIIKNGTVLTFLDVSSRLNSGLGEQGLLGIAFPPGYGSTTSALYTNYTGTSGTGDTVISRFTANSDPDVIDPSSEEVLLSVVQPFANHNGGQVAFGPDGYLYIGMGDGGSGGDPFNYAQNTLSRLGKMLRIDVQAQPSGYAIPPGNPFVGNAAYLPEIWALGLRNPWRFSFDRETGDLFIADVGQGAYEEINFQPAAAGGANYGWNRMEGMHCYSAVPCDQTGLTLPIAEYGHGSGDCSVTGGVVYRGTAIPALQGVYLYGDLCSGRIWGLRLSGSAVENWLLLETRFMISTFGEDEAGNVYVADYLNGNIYRIVTR